MQKESKGHLEKTLTGREIGKWSGGRQHKGWLDLEKDRIDWAVNSGKEGGWRRILGSRSYWWEGGQAEGRVVVMWWVSLIHSRRNGVPEKVNIREWSGVGGVNRDTRRNRLTHREHAMRARLTTSPFATLRELIAPPMWGGDDGCLLPTDRGFLWQSVRVLLSQGKNVTLLKCHVPRERLDFFRCARGVWTIRQCGVFGTSPAPHPGTTRRRIFKPALSASHHQFVLLPLVVIWFPSVEFHGPLSCI